MAADSIDMNIVYKKSRYDRGEAAYLNCPMTKEQYEKFSQELLTLKLRNYMVLKIAMFLRGVCQLK